MQVFCVFCLYTHNIYSTVMLKSFCFQKFTVYMIFDLLLLMDWLTFMFYGTKIKGRFLHILAGAGCGEQISGAVCLARFIQVNKLCTCWMQSQSVNYVVCNGHIVCIVKTAQFVLCFYWYFRDL